MLAEIIANGDEITSGKVLDTNSQWLSRELESLGIAVQYHTAVGDEFGSMVNVLRIAMSRVDVIIITGGLGPTADDLTRQAVADLAGVPLIEHPESLRHVQEIYRRRSVPVPENARRQTLQPKGAKHIHNPHGTAPGIDLTLKRTMPIPEGRLDFVRLLSYPGVPAEMVEMWNDSGRQTLSALLTQVIGKQHVIKDRSIHSFGLGESVVENMLSGITQRGHVPRVGITATQGTITLRIVAEGDTEDECDVLIEPVAKLIYETLGDRIFGEGPDTLADVVSRMALLRGTTFAVVESGTRGLLANELSAANRLNEQAGKSPFLGGIVLGGIVLPPTIPAFPEMMTEIGQRLFGADDFLLVGPYPSGKPDRTRSEEVFVAVSSPGGSRRGDTNIQIQRFPFVGHPGIIDDLFVKRALDMYRLLFTAAE